MFGDAWVRSGGTLKELGSALGHSREETMLRYTARQASKNRAQMEAVAKELGLDRAHLKVLDVEEA